MRDSYGPEFFDKAKPNRFAGKEMKFKGSRAVLLDEDVAEVFDSGEAVNTVLRSTIKAMRTSKSIRFSSSSKQKKSVRDRKAAKS
jgi:hypothetical protein